MAEERRESGEEGAVKDYSHIPHGREREREVKAGNYGERERETVRSESSSCERILYLPF